MNYFNYFTEIEDTFIRRRGKHLLLSPMDWALIESWKEMKIPLHVALRGIERSFDSWEAKPRKRTVKSLLYCQEEVEAQFAEWLEARVGAGVEENSSAEEVAHELGSDDGLPFSRRSILDHLDRGVSTLQHLLVERKRSQEDDLCEALGRAASLLADLRTDFATATSPDAQRLEDSLTGLERMLNESILRVVSSDQLETIMREVATQLKPYANHMDQVAYRQTSDNLVLKRLREHFAVPRLSLFYL